MSSSVAIACSQRPACRPPAGCLLCGEKADGWVVKIEADEIRRATMGRAQHFPWPFAVTAVIDSDWRLADGTSVAS